MPLSTALLFALSLPSSPLPQGSEAEGEVRVELEDLTGRVREVALADFRTDDPRQLGAVFVRYRGLAEPEPVGAPVEDVARVLLTREGDALSGAVRGGEGDELTLEIVGGGRIALSIEEIAGLIFDGRLPHEGVVTVVPADEGDRLFRRRGSGVDRVDGLFQSFGADGVRFESRLGEKLYPWREVAALFIEDLEGAGDLEGSAGVPVIVDLHGQSRLHGELIEMDAEACRIATRTNPSLTLPAGSISEVALDDGSYRFLSDLPPTDLGPVSPTGDDLGMVWPPRMDRARTGDVLRAGGRAWTRGIGVQSPSRITWELDGGWDSLTGRVAIDDSVLSLPRRGSVVFRVWVDGDRRFESPVVRGGDPPVDLGRIELAGARELVLEVDPSVDLWMADRADWLRPILVRRP